MGGEFKVEIKETAEKDGVKGEKYISIDGPKYKAQLFRIKAAPSGKGSDLAFNCSLFSKEASINLSFPVRKIVAGEKSGEFLAGDKTRLNSHRAVVTEFIKTGVDQAGKATGHVVDRASIPYSEYKDLMEAIKEGNTLLDATLAQTASA